MFMSPNTLERESPLGVLCWISFCARPISVLLKVYCWACLSHCAAGLSQQRSADFHFFRSFSFSITMFASSYRSWGNNLLRNFRKQTMLCLFSKKKIKYTNSEKIKRRAGSSRQHERRAIVLYHRRPRSHALLRNRGLSLSVRADAPLLISPQARESKEPGRLPRRPLALGQASNLRSHSRAIQRRGFRAR